MYSPVMGFGFIWEQSPYLCFLLISSLSDENISPGPVLSLYFESTQQVSYWTTIRLRLNQTLTLINI